MLMQTKPSRNQYTAPVSIAEEILAIASLHIEKITPDTALSLAHRYDLTLSENGKDIYTIQFDRMTDTKFEHNIISYFGTASSEKGVIKLTNEGGQQVEKLLQEAMQKKQSVD
ncbi:MAG: hypothetical protein KAS23_07525 [Anaerohalosphaera sp.]|nr:hypothetical protein [Anaerohalosphaera sp.]